MNQWDKISDIFNSQDKQTKIPKTAADNILIAWPSIIKIIKKKLPLVKNLSALDFGCGTGEFCRKLHCLGFKVSGIDSSARMVKTARYNLPKKIDIFRQLPKNTKYLPQYNLITSIMVFQFIENIEKTLVTLDKILKPGGLLVFAVFNPAFVKNLIKKKIIFNKFSSNSYPQKGIMEIVKNTPIPVFIRDEKFYDKLVASLGYQKIASAYPPFTKKFLKIYPMGMPVQDAEFLIIGFQKNNINASNNRHE